MADPILAINATPSVDERMAALFALPVPLRLKLGPSQTVGSFVSDGVAFPGSPSVYHDAIDKITDISTEATSTSLTTANIATKKFLAPASGAMTIKSLSACISVGYCNQTNSNNMYLERVDVVISKISSSGTETNLATITGTTVSFVNSSNSYAVAILGCSGAVNVSIGATERLCIVVKTYGKIGSATAVHSLNVAAGATFGSNARYTNTAQSWVVLEVET